MISFSQFILLVFVIFLLFGDIKAILSRILVLFFNFRIFLKNKLRKQEKKDEQK
jgi:hypothetical protein